MDNVSALISMVPIEILLIKYYKYLGKYLNITDTSLTRGPTLLVTAPIRKLVVLQCDPAQTSYDLPDC